MNADGTRKGDLPKVSLGLAAAVLVGCLLVASERVEAAFVGTNGRVAFQSERNGNWEIYAMNPDGSGQSRLTDNRAWEGEPAVSPDGQRIAFVTDRHGGPDHEEIYVMDAADSDNDGNGDNPLRLTDDTTPDWSPAFSPEGTKIAYQHYADGDSEIFVMNSDGTGPPIRLTNNDLFDGVPVFSANGTEIYFCTDRDGDPNQRTELYAMDVRDIDGDGNGEDQRELFGDPAIDYFAAAISPDDKKLAYQDYRDRDSEIYLRDLDGSGTPTRLTTNSTWDGLPAFSPDGKKLVFGSDRDLGPDQEEIYTMDIVDADNDGNGDNQNRLTEDTTSDYEPDWGPLLPEAPPAFLREWGSPGTAEGQFAYPASVAVDSSGNVYVADKDNNRIEKFGPNGTFLTRWGSRGSGNGQLRYPRGVEVDSSGNVYVADTFNRRIQKFGPNGRFITKWGSQGSADGQFALPSDVAVGPSGNVYVADPSANRIQKFGPDGTFLTRWGGGGTANGRFDWPSSIATDSSGTVYVADTGNARIQKFDANGAFLTGWGSGGPGNGQFGNASGVATDSRGNVYVTEDTNNRIQKFGPDGTFLTRWGGGGTADGRFDGPTSVDLDPSGNVYVVDQGNHRIQKFGEKRAPSVVTVVPKGGAAGVALDTKVIATFSEQMDKTTLSKANFKLFEVTANGPIQVTDVTITPSLDGKKITLDPYGAASRSLDQNTEYKAEVTTGTRDLAGNHLDQNPGRLGSQQKVWYFTTGRTG
jgi:Tol biopolymer transport system component/streptogramin lyase